MQNSHLYGPVSGKIEPTDPDPLSAALREIAEETSLTPSSHLSLLAVGQPYSFADPDVGKEFEVHPFAFALRREAAEGEVRLCAENDEWRWFRPGDVVDEGTVPKVRESLGRVMRARWEAWPAPEG